MVVVDATVPLWSSCLYGRRIAISMRTSSQSSRVPVTVQLTNVSRLTLTNRLILSIGNEESACYRRHGPHLPHFPSLSSPTRTSLTRYLNCSHHLKQISSSGSSLCKPQTARARSQQDAFPNTAKVQAPHLQWGSFAARYPAEFMKGLKGGGLQLCKLGWILRR